MGVSFLFVGEVSQSKLIEAEVNAIEQQAVQRLATAVVVTLGEFSIANTCRIPAGKASKTTWWRGGMGEFGVGLVRRGGNVDLVVWVVVSRVALFLTSAHLVHVNSVMLSITKTKGGREGGGGGRWVR